MSSGGKGISRRQFLRRAAILGAGIAVAGPILAACGPTPTPKVIEKVVEKEVTKIVAGTPVKEVIRETVVVEKEKLVTPTPAVKRIASIRWHWWGLTLRSFNDTLIPMWEKDNPDIELKAEMAAEGDWLAQIEAMVLGGTAPDCCYAQAPIVKLYDTGHILDIKPRVLADGIDLKKDYCLIGTEFWGDAIFGLPCMFEVTGWYYNKTMLKAAGAKDPWDDLGGKWTEKDLVEMATRCAAKQGQYGMWWEHYIEVYGSLAWARGQDMVNWQTLKYQLDKPENIKIFQMVYDWMFKDKIMITPAGERAESQGGIANVYVAGKCAFRERFSGDAAPLRFPRQIAGQFAWDIAPWPYYDATHPGIPWGNGYNNSIFKASKQPDAAYKFIKYVAGEKVQKAWADSTTNVPVLIKLHEAYEKSTPAHVSIFTKALRTGYGCRFAHHLTSKCNTLFNEQRDLAYLQQKPLEQALKDATAEMNKNISLGTVNPYKELKVPWAPLAGR